MKQTIQRFGAAMFVPVLFFAFYGMTVGISILATSQDILGDLAAQGTLWHMFWSVIQEGAWTVFRQLPLLFAVGLPIALAKKAEARACLEALLIYLTFNYFVSGILQVAGPVFGVDYSLPVGVDPKTGLSSGLAMIAGIKTLDTGMLGAIFVSAIAVYLHGKFYDKRIPEFLGIFQGSAFVAIIGFAAMLPVALLTCLLWPKVQLGIGALQGFLASSGVIGVWLYTFLERILIPTGLHHFVYGPFVFGPAAVPEGLYAWWNMHLADMVNVASLKETFPAGGFQLHGSSKVFGCPGIALAIYATAKPEKKKITASLLIPATLTAMLVGITEPLEFTFLFIAPVLFAVHAVLAATLAATMYSFGVVGNFGGGLIDNYLPQNWLPLFKYHSDVYITQIIIGLTFTAIYFFVFRFLILKYNFSTPGREADDEETRLFTKADYKAREGAAKLSAGTATPRADDSQAAQVIAALGGRENIIDVTNCATRLRVSVKDETKLAPDRVFKAAKAHGVARSGKAIQVIIGLSVPILRTEVEALLEAQPQSAATQEFQSISMKAFASGKVIAMTEVPDQVFSQKMMGDGVAIWPDNQVVTAPADGEITMVTDQSGHAIGMKLKNGLEILLHIGLDTVNMSGEGFTVFVEPGQKVQAGTELVRFDRKRIEEKGYSPVVIMAVTNFDQYPMLSFYSGVQAEANKTVVATY